MNPERRRFLKIAAATVALPMIPLPATAPAFGVNPIVCGIMREDVNASQLRLFKLGIFPALALSHRQADPAEQ